MRYAFLWNWDRSNVKTKFRMVDIIPCHPYPRNDRKLQIQTLSCCGTLWNWNQSSCSFSVSSMGFTFFKSKFFSMYPQQTFLHSKPSMSRSYVLNISKKMRRCADISSCYMFQYTVCTVMLKEAVICSNFQTNVKAQPNNGQGVPIFSCCMRSTV